MDNELLQAISQMLDKKLDEALQPLKEGQAKLEAGQSALEAGQAGLVAGQATLKEDVEFIRGRVVAIEVGHGKKLDALFDGYALLSEKLPDLESIDRRLENIEITVGVHDLRLKEIK